MIKIYKNIHDFPRNARIAVYGAGGRGRNLIAIILSQRPDIKIDAVFDDYIAGKNVLGFDVIDYDDSSKSWSYILIASIHVHEIIKKIKPHEKVLLLDESSNISAGQKIGWKYLYKNFTRVIYCLIRFENPFVYLTLLLKRLGFPVDVAGYVVNKKFNNQYLDFIFKNEIKFACDLGVHDGYTSIQFLNNFTQLLAIHGFDISFEALDSSVNYQELVTSNKFHFEKKAVYSYDGKISISVNLENLSASTVVGDQDHNSEVECITLDAFKNHKNNKIDFIKFDIEGAELEALKGGIKTIITDRPQLAVSIYHSAEDFIQIPIFLMGKLENYKFHVGHYSTGIFETVLYCIPKELYELTR